MDAIGWNASGGGGGSTSTSQPTGVSVTAATASLNAAQGSTGLAAKAALATFNQIGGLATTLTRIFWAGPARLRSR